MVNVSRSRCIQLSEPDRPWPGLSGSLRADVKLSDKCKRRWLFSRFKTGTDRCALRQIMNKETKRCWLHSRVSIDQLSSDTATVVSWAVASVGHRSLAATQLTLQGCRLPLSSYTDNSFPVNLLDSEANSHRLPPQLTWHKAVTRLIKCTTSQAIADSHASVSWLVRFNVPLDT